MVKFSNANLEVVQKLARVSATKTIGSPGTALWGGYVDDGEKNSDLIGSNRYKTYSDILANVSIVSAGVRYFLNLMSSSSWNVQPADENSAESVRYAEEIEFAMGKLKTPWRRVIRKAATYKFYGFSVQEWTARRLDTGLISIHRIDSRPQATINRWLRDDFGDIEAIEQMTPQNMQPIEIPRDKLIYVVDDALSDSPEGFGIFRHLAEPTRRLKRFEQLEGYGFESDLRGIPIGRAPFAKLQELVKAGTITEAEKTAIIKPLIDFMSNHVKNPQLGVLLDSITYESTGDSNDPTTVRQWDMELLKAGSTSQAEIDKTITRLNEEIARILSMEGLLLGSGPTGSRALSVDKTRNLAIVVDSTQKELAETLNIDFIGSIGKLNGWDENLWPTFSPEPIRFKDVSEITQSLVDMSQAGAILDPEDPVIDAVRELLRMPKQPEIININRATDSSLVNRNRQSEEDNNVTSD